MSIYHELKLLALNQHNTKNVKKLHKYHAELLENGDLKELHKVIEADNYENQHWNYACEILVTDY
jgi:hypothetical protein